MRDITEYKAMEDRLLQSERLAAVGNTVAHIAHEIKNPLLIIGGFARQLLKLPQLDDQARHKLSIIAEEVSHLEEMVAEMRDFVRRPPVHKQPGRIEAAIREAVDLFQDFFQEHQIQVRQVEETRCRPCPSTPRQLHEVLINLLKNAVEAMPQGGEITIASRVRGNFVEVSVSDTRRGHPAGGGGQYFPALFHHQGKGHRSGAGHLPEYHPGARRLLLADSTPGRGSTFTIQLPLGEDTRRWWKIDMTTPKPMRIAIVLNGEAFVCPPVTLPFSLADHPPVELILVRGRPRGRCSLPARAPGGFAIRKLSTSFWTANF